MNYNNVIIQLAFDWCGYHAYNFEVEATLYEMEMRIELPQLDNECEVMKEI